MIRALTLLFSLQLAGEAAARALGLPVPGPVLGMAALWAILMLTGGPSESLEGVARGFLDNLGLLFVPAGVGITLHLAIAAQEWRAILAAVVVGTLVTMVATALVFRWLARLSDDKEGESAHDA
jgi:holin-like protein